MFLHDPLEQVRPNLGGLPFGSGHADRERDVGGRRDTLAAQEGQLEDKVVQSGAQVMGDITDDGCPANGGSLNGFDEMPRDRLTIRLDLFADGYELGLSWGVARTDLLLQEVEVLIRTPVLRDAPFEGMTDGESRHGEIGYAATGDNAS